MANIKCPNCSKGILDENNHCSYCDSRFTHIGNEYYTKSPPRNILPTNKFTLLFIKRFLIFLPPIFIIILLFVCSRPNSHTHEWLDATCTEPKICKTCNETDTDSTPLNHMVLEWKITKEADCANPGTKVGMCNRCETKITRTIDASTQSHQVSDWQVTVPATCTDYGTEVGICSVCNSECTRDIEPLGHIESKWKITTAASLYESGEKTKCCKTCGDELDSQVYDLDTYQEGMYKVGTDIPAGEYILICDSSTAYFEISSDSTGNLDSIIANDNFSTNSIITVHSGEYLNLSRCYAVPADDSLKLDVSGEGMFRVGIDIKAGEYKLICNSDIMGYYEVAPNSLHHDITSNDNFKNSAYITVRNGQYLKLSRCYIEQ